MSGHIQTKKSQLNVKIDETLHEELKIQSIRKGKNLNLIVEEALQAQLETNNLEEGEIKGESA